MIFLRNLLLHEKNNAIESAAWNRKDVRSWLERVDFDYFWTFIISTNLLLSRLRFFFYCEFHHLFHQIFLKSNKSTSIVSKSLNIYNLIIIEKPVQIFLTRDFWCRNSGSSLFSLLNEQRARWILTAVWSLTAALFRIR